MNFFLLVFFSNYRNFSRVFNVRCFRICNLQLLDELSAYDQDPQANLLKDFLSSATPALMHNGNQLFSQMSLHPAAVDRYRTSIESPPFPTLMPLTPKVMPAAGEESPDLAWNFNVIKRLNEDSNYVITVSTERKEISVWDVHT